MYMRMLLSILLTHIQFYDSAHASEVAKHNIKKNLITQRNNNSNIKGQTSPERTKTSGIGNTGKSGGQSQTFFFFLYIKHNKCHLKIKRNKFTGK